MYRFCLILTLSIQLLQNSRFSDFQIRPCAVDDFQCISEAFENFFTKTASGVPNLNIKPTDPLILESVNSNIFKGVLVHFKNVNVTGLSKEKLTEYK